MEFALARFLTTSKAQPNHPAKSKLRVELDDPDASFFPGEVVKGKVVIHLLEGLKRVESVSLELRRIEEASAGYHEPGGGFHDKETTKLTLLSQKIWIHTKHAPPLPLSSLAASSMSSLSPPSVASLSNHSASAPSLHLNHAESSSNSSTPKSDTTSAPGATTPQGKDYPFEFKLKLPENLAPSVKFEEWVSLSYNLRAIVKPIEITVQGLKSAAEDINVIGTHPAQWKLRDQVSEGLKKTIEKSFWISSREKVRLTAQTKKDVFLIGEKAPITIKINNISNRLITSISFALIQEIRTSCPKNPERVIVRSSLVENTIPECKVLPQSGLEKIARLLIPTSSHRLPFAIFPSTPCKHFAISHFITVTCTIQGLLGWNSDTAEVTLPISIFDRLSSSNKEKYKADVVGFQQVPLSQSWDPLKSNPEQIYNQTLTVYTIRVQKEGQGNSSWEVFKKYSDFLELQALLSNEFHSIPELDSKQKVSNNCKDLVPLLEDRVEQLSEFLELLCSMTSIRDSTTMHEFLNLNTYDAVA